MLNLYFVGTKIHSSWSLTTSEGIILIDTLYEYALDDAIVGGMKKLGLDPASVKYTIISHAHGVFSEVKQAFVNKAHPPASTTVQVAQLTREGVLVEVDVIAVVPA